MSSPRRRRFRQNSVSRSRRKDSGVEAEPNGRITIDDIIEARNALERAWAKYFGSTLHEGFTGKRLAISARSSLFLRKTINTRGGFFDDQQSISIDKIPDLHASRRRGPLYAHLRHSLRGFDARQVCLGAAAPHFARLANFRSTPARTSMPGRKRLGKLVRSTSELADRGA